jgi:hypothetical protein
MNWYMIRQTLKGAGEIARVNNQELTEEALADKVGELINRDPRLATQIMVEAWNLWKHGAPDVNDPKSGEFWFGHRQGESGLKYYAHFDDVRRYYDGVATVQKLCEGDPHVWTNKKRYWAEVPPV